MNPFVDPKKRDFLLPQGCKELSDVISRSKPRTASAAGIVSGRTQPGTIADLQLRIMRFLQLSWPHRSLTIITPKKPVSLYFSEGRISITLFVTEGAEEA